MNSRPSERRDLIPERVRLSRRAERIERRGRDDALQLSGKCRVRRDEGVGLELRQRDVLGVVGRGPAEPVGHLPGPAGGGRRRRAGGSAARSGAVAAPARRRPRVRRAQQPRGGSTAPASAGASERAARAPDGPRPSRPRSPGRRRRRPRSASIGDPPGSAGDPTLPPLPSRTCQVSGLELATPARRHVVRALRGSGGIEEARRWSDGPRP